VNSEEKVLEFADELTEEQMFAVNGGGRFSSSSSSGSSSSGRGSHSSGGGSRSSGSGNSKKSSGSSIGSRIGSAVSSIGSKISNAFSGNKSSGSASASDKKKESSYVPYKGLPGYTPPARADGAEPKKSSTQTVGTATEAPAVTRTTNGSADNPPGAVSGSPSTYLTRPPESATPAVAGLTGSPSTYLSKQPVVSGFGNKYRGGTSSFPSSGSSSSSASSSSNSYSSNTSIKSIGKSSAGTTANPPAAMTGSPSTYLTAAVGPEISQTVNTENAMKKLQSEMGFRVQQENLVPVSQSPVINQEKGYTKIVDISEEYKTSMQDHLNDSLNGTMYDGIEKYEYTKEAYEAELKKDKPAWNGDILDTKFYQDETGIDKVSVTVQKYTSFSNSGCKVASVAIIIEQAIGKTVDIKEIDEFDKDRDGLFSTEECLSAFKHYLAEGDDVSVDRYDNDLSVTNGKRFDRKKIEEIAKSDNEVYVIARAQGVCGGSHWVVLKGYDEVSVMYKNEKTGYIEKTNQLRFDYRGSSKNDRNRTYVLGQKVGNQYETYGVDCIEVYNVKRGKSL